MVLNLKARAIMDAAQEAEILKAIERGDFGKPDQFKIKTTLDLMMRRTRKTDDVNVEYKPKPVIELPSKKALSLMEVSDSIAQALNPLPDASRKRVLKKIISEEQLAKFKALADIDPLAKSEIVGLLAGLTPQQRYTELIKYNNDQNKNFDLLQAKTKALGNCQAWLTRLNKCENYTLERNDVSRLHKYIEACRAGRLVNISKPPSDAAESEFIIPPQTFVVKHDWANAFKTASGLEDGIKLPYEYCSFEFRLNGNTVLIHAFEVPVSDEYKDGICLNAMVECLDHWMMLSEDSGDQDNCLGFLWTQIRAICIALDAEVATEEVVRAPSALNAKRVKAGKIPLRDYHIVDLSRRHRVANPLAGESGVRHRMHFVRGHWRHYEEHKTWIKWHLRGNPDLGFIQKHYSL